MKLRSMGGAALVALAASLSGCEPGQAIEGQDREKAAELDAWRYPELPDRLRGTVAKYAVTTGLEPVRLKLNGGEDADVKLLLRRNGDGENVIFQIEAGAFLCNMYAGDTIAVRFDDRPISKYRCVTAGDGDPQTLYIDADEKFISNLKRSERLIVELPFLADGNRQVEFRTGGLVWD